MRLSAVAILSALALGACSSQPTVPTTTQLRGSWQLAGPVPVWARRPTVTFHDSGAIAGNAGVNQFRGSVDAQALLAGRWQAGAVATTRMAGTPEAMALEAGFLQAIAGAREAVLRDGVLELKNGNEVLLRLEQLRLRP